MEIHKIFFLYVFTLAVFLLVDLLWLGVVAKSFYQKQLAVFFKDQINWVAAFIFYMIFIAGILIFVVSPALNKDSLLSVIVLGSLFGLITYATYDLTNLSTIKDWPMAIVIVDMIWGMVLSCSVSVFSFLFGKHILKWLQ